jgi:hypothetical protein
MATNPHFSDFYTAFQFDQSLAEDLIIESIQCKGIDLYYLPRDLTNFDSFFGEDQISSFNSASVVEFYMENVQSWQDDGQFLSKFGMEIRDSATFAVAMRRFSEEVTSKYPEVVRPREGDVLVLPRAIDNRRRAMEITNVRNEEQFYQLGKLYIWTVTVKNFEYTGEEFNTGIEEIDDYNDFALTTTIILEAGAGTFVPGEQVSQLGGFGGEVVFFNSTTNELVLSKISGELNPLSPIVGDTASRNIASEGSSVGRDTMMNDNDYTEEKVEEGLISFSENNPFSES